MLPQPLPPALVGPGRCLHLRIRCWLRRHPRWQICLWVVIYVLAFVLLASGTRYLVGANR